ncbi:MAG: DUF2461 domain-containing protein [Firmicutes bacterium]|nr:DUF2461 domain-containing protein [Bacillota bacterium]
MFTGFPREMFAFFAALRFNNNKAFFEENRESYQRFVRAPLIALAEALAPALQAIDPLLDIRAGQAVSRIYRDVRFSKDKSPYRDYMWICYRRVGEPRGGTCGFYFDISDNAANWGCGYYQARPDVMCRLRNMILEKPRQVLAVITAPAFAETYALMGDAYARQYQPPEGLAAPLGPLFSKKNVYAEHHLRDMENLFSPSLAERIIEDYRAAAPFYALLRECMIPKAEEARV